MAGEDSSYALQVAVSARLAADATLSALVDGRVYTQARDGPRTPTPWVQIDNPEMVGPFEGQGFAGVELFLTVRVWARPGEAGQQPMGASAQLLRITAAIRDSLHGETFPLIEHSLKLCEHLTTRIVRDQDGRTRQAILEFRVLTTAV